MKVRGRVLVLAVSLPVIAFAVIGGFIGKAMAREDSYQYLRIFEDVVTLIVSNYVEEVDVDKVMHGAMHGLADGLDPDSAYLNTEQVKTLDKADSTGAGETGLEITRQYYLRVIAARDGSPAARAGLMPGDYIRAIDGQSTRDTSVYEGQHLLRGKAGSRVSLTVLRGNAAEPHVLELVREDLPSAPVKGRIAAPGVGYLRVAEFGQCPHGREPQFARPLGVGGEPGHARGPRGRGHALASQHGQRVRYVPRLLGVERRARLREARHALGQPAELRGRVRDHRGGAAPAEAGGLLVSGGARSGGQQHRGPDRGASQDSEAECAHRHLLPGAAAPRRGPGLSDGRPSSFNLAMCVAWSAWNFFTSGTSPGRPRTARGTTHCRSSTPCRRAGA